MKIKKLTKLVIFFSIIANLVFINTAFAYTGDISISGNSIRVSDNNILEGEKIRIYISVSNNSNKDLLGYTKFYINDKQTSADQAISIFAGKTDDVFIDWTADSYGEKTIKAQIFPWDTEIDNPANNVQTLTIVVKRDTDRDGIENLIDNDDDNDGVIDTEDDFPLNKQEQYDTDGDGEGNNSDNDDDNDGVPDEFDDMPLNPNETLDTDKDNIGNIKDLDDDNDGISDIDEEKEGTNPLKNDTDEDGYLDNQDAFPTDKNEWIDTDQDKIGNNTDTDDDNDSLIDENDEYPLNKGPVIKLKSDYKTISLYKTENFDASPSYDEDGEIVAFYWEFENEKKEGNAVEHKFETKGKQEIKVTVVDNIGEKRTMQFQVNVINTRMYSTLISLLLTIILAMIIYLKYIAEAKKDTNSA